METPVILNPISANATMSGEHLRMTYEEYLAWAGDDKRGEWVNGEVIEFMPPKALHQNLTGFFYTLLTFFVKMFKLGYVGIAPLEVRLSPDISREPDIFFVSKSRMNIVNDDRVEGVPDLIVEVVSKDSVQRDREDKFDEYEAAGVHEYWIIDNRPRRQWAGFYRLDAPNGVYQRIEPVNGVFYSDVIKHFWLRIDWLWQSNPDEVESLREIINETGINPFDRKN